MRESSTTDRLALPPPQLRPLTNLGCTLPFSDFDRYSPLFPTLGLIPEYLFSSDDVHGADGPSLDRAREFSLDLGPTTFHAPFVSMFSGSEDATMRERTVETLLRAADCAARLGARSVVMHSGWDPRRFDDFEAWLSRAVPGLARVTAHCVDLGVRPLLENTREATPSVLLRLLGEVHDETRVCLDPSHAVVATDLDAEAWAEGVGSLLYEIHLHNNGGSADEHLAVDQGRAWDPNSLLTKLIDAGIPFVPVLEPKDRETANRSLAALSAWGLFEGGQRIQRSSR